MESAASNKACLEHAFAETGKGNGGPFLEALADEAVWSVKGSTGWSRTYRGKAAILNELLGPLSAKLRPPMKTHAHRLIAEGAFVAVQGRGENRTWEGAPYENSYCWVFEFFGGKIIGIEEYADTELISRVLGAPESRRPAIG